MHGGHRTYTWLLPQWGIGKVRVRPRPLRILRNLMQALEVLTLGLMRIPGDIPLGRRERRVVEERVSHHSPGTVNGAKGLHSSNSHRNNHSNRGSHSNRTKEMVQERRGCPPEGVVAALVAEVVAVEVEVAMGTVAVAVVSVVIHGDRDRRSNHSSRTTI